METIGTQFFQDITAIVSRNAKMSERSKSGTGRLASTKICAVRIAPTVFEEIG